MDDDLTTRHHDGPVDASAAAALAAQGLELRLVRNARPELDGWIGAVRRGFLDPEATEAQLDAATARNGYRRMIGVYDPAGPMPEVPVGTFASWTTDLTVPGERTTPMVAISAVTVAPTHQGRGIARAMMEGELRHAVALGVPMAGLTVSESTIYGRYGFGPAVAATTWRIDTKRAHWEGPTAPGRVDHVPRATARALLPRLHDEVRLRRPGEIPIPGSHWDRVTELHPDADKPGRVRAAQYADPAGRVRGLVLYTVTENEDDFTKSSVRVSHLVAVDAEAYAALWRHLIELPLIGTVTASELSVDEPLLWMLSDQRAAEITVSDHHYVRVLDVPAALQARGYDTPGAVALEVSDPLGHSSGRWLLEAGADGSGRVRADGGPDVPEIPVLRLGTAALSTVYLGGVSVSTLAAAGRVESTDAAAAAAVLGHRAVPQLSFWY